VSSGCTNLFKQQKQRRRWPVEHGLKTWIEEPGPPCRKRPKVWIVAAGVRAGVRNFLEAAISAA
jgi:hypothetical protein